MKIRRKRTLPARNIPIETLAAILPGNEITIRRGQTFEDHANNRNRYGVQIVVRYVGLESHRTFAVTGDSIYHAIEKLKRML